MSHIQREKAALEQIRAIHSAHLYLDKTTGRLVGRFRFSFGLNTTPFAFLLCTFKQNYKPFVLLTKYCIPVHTKKKTVWNSAQQTFSTIINFRICVAHFSLSLPDSGSRFSCVLLFLTLNSMHAHTQSHTPTPWPFIRTDTSRI